MLDLKNGQVFVARGRLWTARHVPERDDVDVIIADPHSTTEEDDQERRLVRTNEQLEKKGRAVFPSMRSFPFPIVGVEEVVQVLA